MKPDPSKQNQLELKQQEDEQEYKRRIAEKVKALEEDDELRWLRAQVKNDPPGLTNRRPQPRLAIKKLPAPQAELPQADLEHQLQELERQIREGPKP